MNRVPTQQLSRNDTKAFAYRTTRALPAQIADRVAISIDEQLFSQALYLLTQCLTAGGGESHAAAAVPSSEILALIATLAVHPSMTTRTTSTEKQNAAHQALKYLYMLNTLTGAHRSGIRVAFQFNDLQRSRSGRAKARSAQNDRNDQLQSDYAKRESLWEHTSDIWALIGWSFNCAVLHSQRWQYWKTFLSLLIDVLSDDLESSLQQSPQATSTSTDNDSLEVGATLVAQYLACTSGGSQQKRRIMRASLADGSPKSVAEFGEIWPAETRLPQARQEKSGRKYKLDLDNGEYADYDASSGEDDLTSSAQEVQDRPILDATLRELSANRPLGDVDAIDLRQRLFDLLFRFCFAAPQLFLSPEELLDLYAESFRGLHITSFRQLLFPAAAFRGPYVKPWLNQLLLRTLVGSSAPMYHNAALTQEDFERYYAPFPASSHSVLDNAQTSVLVEDLLRILWTSQALQYTEDLRTAVVKGIKLRNEKARPDARKRGPEKEREEQECRQELESSAVQMLCLLDMIQ